MSLHRKLRRSFSGVAIAIVLGLTLGIAGTASYALWRDSVAMGGTISSGYQYFAAGLLGDPAIPDLDNDPMTVTVPSGWEADATATLLLEESVAVVFETQSLSQGNKGLRYEIQEPESWGDGLFGDSTVRLYWVNEPSECAVDVPRPEAPDWVEGYTSTPVSDDYSTTTVMVTEYWCLVASYSPPPPVVGQYRNTAEVTGNGELDEVLTDSDSWYAPLSRTYDDTADGPFPIRFTYSTFRPDAPEVFPTDPEDEGE